MNASIAMTAIGRTHARHSVFLVEDDAEVRESLRERIESDPRLHVVVAVGNCAAMLAALRRGRPDVLLVDLGLPDGDGHEVIRAAAARYPGLSIMVITVFGDERRVLGAIRAGATGYLLKDDRGQALGEAIVRLMQGESPISAGIARHIIHSCRAQEVRNDCTSDCDARLTARELEVLSLAAKGFSYVEIGQLLGVSVNTVSSYTKRLYEKLAVRSRAEAIYEASRLGLLEPVGAHR